MKKPEKSRDVALARLCRRESTRRREARILCLWQRSFVFRALRALREIVAATPLYSLALFLAPMGLASLFRCLILPLLTDDFPLLPSGAFTGVVLSLLSLFLSMYHTSLSRVAGLDTLPSRLLFDTLALPRPYVTQRRGIPWWILLPLGLGLGVLSIYVSPLLLFGILLASALLLPALEVPEVALILIGIVFPFSGLLGHPLLFLIVLVLFSVLAYLLKLALGKRRISPTPGDLFVLLFSLTILFTGLITPSGANGSLSGLTVAVLAAGGYFLTANLLHTRRGILLLVRGLLSGGAVLGVLGILLGILELAFPALPADGFLFHLIEGIEAITGESFSSYLLLLLPLSLGLMGSSRGEVAKSLPTFLLLLSALVLTLSPTAYLAAILSLILFLIAVYRPFRALPPLAFLLLAVLPIGVLFLPSEWVDTLASGLPFPGLDTALPEAFSLFREALAVVRTHPLGTGEGLLSVPSLYLGLMLESGIFALILFLLALYLPLRRNLIPPGERAARPLCRLSAGVAAGLLSLPVSGVLENGFADRRVLLLFFLLLGLLSAIGRTAREEESLSLDRPAEPRLASTELRLLHRARRR